MQYENGLLNRFRTDTSNSQLTVTRDSLDQIRLR